MAEYHIVQLRISRDTSQNPVDMDIRQHLFLSIPENAINPQDSELQIFTKYFSRINHTPIKNYIGERDENGKNSNVSKVLRKQGNEYFAKECYVLAVTYYNRSLEMAPCDSLEYAVCLANRSAVLFSLQRYKDCLMDVNRVLESKYPRLLMYKVFCRQAKCCLELKRYEAVTEIVQTYKQWLEQEKVNLTQLQIDNIHESLNDIERSLAENRATIDDSVDQVFAVVALQDGENPQFAYASKTVTVMKNTERGRHVVASGDIKKGDILFVEKPYSTSCTSTHMGYFTYCNLCFVSSLTCIPCKYCTEIYFCSEQCREENWNMRHKWECVAIRKRLFSSQFSLALAILFETSRTGFNTTVHDETYVYGNKQDNYPYVNQLLTHRTDIPMSKLILYVRTAVLLVIYLIHSTDYFDWLYAQSNRPKGSRKELYNFVGGILLKILFQIESNGETVLYSSVLINNKFSPGLNYHTVANALYVSSCLMNHSCLPNTLRSFHGSTKVVRALTDIEKGTEITICYMRDPNLNDVSSRQSELMQKYYFTCTCCACARNEWLYPWLCSRCQGQALTTSSGTSAKCLDCHHTFSLRRYEETEQDAQVYLNRAMISFSRNTATLLIGLAKLERIYYRSNLKFLAWYSSVIEFCDKIGDYQGCLKHIDSMIRTQQTVVGANANVANVNTSLRRSVSYLNYCLSLNSRTSQIYRNALDEAKDAIDSCAELLTYHMCPRLVDCYKQNMMQILISGSLYYDKTMLLFHYNSIPLNVEVRTADHYLPNTDQFSFKR